MKTKQIIEDASLWLTALICILVPVLDFIGALDQVGWLSRRIGTITLLALGLLTAYIIIALSSAERRRREIKDEILSKMPAEGHEKQVIQHLRDVWAKRDKDSQRFFDQLHERLKSMDKASTPSCLSRVFDEIMGGTFFGSKIDLPWDFTITAMDYQGDLIYHPNPKMIGMRICEQEPYDRILKDRNGAQIYTSARSSEQLAIFFHCHPPGVTRITKAYFKDFASLGVIITLETHVNVIDRLVPLIAKKAEGTV